MLDIKLLGEEVLTQKAVELADPASVGRDYLDSLLATMRSGRGVGLAAPQVGRGERIFVVEVEGDKPRFFVNPEIILRSEDIVSIEEGCLSIPGLYADVKRPSSLKIQAFNERGRPFALDADGFLARVIQHEFDHLEGILFIDRLSELKRKRLLHQWEKRMRA